LGRESLGKRMPQGSQKSLSRNTNVSPNFTYDQQRAATANSMKSDAPLNDSFKTQPYTENL